MWSTRGAARLFPSLGRRSLRDPRCGTVFLAWPPPSPGSSLRDCASLCRRPRRDPRLNCPPGPHPQIDVDSLNQNLDNNKAGAVVGSFSPVVDQVSENRLQPYSEVFGLARFRECELIHGRWAMLATLGCVVAEANTGVSWCALPPR